MVPEKMVLEFLQLSSHLFYEFSKYWGAVFDKTITGKRSYKFGVELLPPDSETHISALRSLRDVQALAGHSSLAMTQLYIDQNTDAQNR